MEYSFIETATHINLMLDGKLSIQQPKKNATKKEQKDFINHCKTIMEKYGYKPT